MEAVIYVSLFTEFNPLKMAQIAQRIGSHLISTNEFLSKLITSLQKGVQALNYDFIIIQSH